MRFGEIRATLPRVDENWRVFTMVELSSLLYCWPPTLVPEFVFGSQSGSTADVRFLPSNFGPKASGIPGQSERHAFHPKHYHCDVNNSLHLTHQDRVTERQLIGAAS